MTISSPIPMSVIIKIKENVHQPMKAEFIWQLIKNYFLKWTGQHGSSPSESFVLFESILTFVGSFLTIALIAVIHYRLLYRYDLIFLIGSFGASAVLLFGAPSSALGQPRNVIGGQLIGSTVGCVIRVLFRPDGEIFIAVALAVSLSIFIMELTGTMHPPGGATALNAIMTQASFPWYGFQYILMPTLSGTVIMLLLAVIINNLSPRRHYPRSWW